MPRSSTLGMAALSDPSVLDIQDEAKQARAAAEVEAYNSASRAEAPRRNAEWWDPGEYHVPTEGVGKVLHDLAVNAPYTLKNMPLARDIKRVLHSIKNTDTYITTMFDYYGLPDDFPEMVFLNEGFYKVKKNNNFN